MAERAGHRYETNRKETKKKVGIHSPLSYASLVWFGLVSHLNRLTLKIIKLKRVSRFISFFQDHFLSFVIVMSLRPFNVGNNSGEEGGWIIITTIVLHSLLH